MCVAFPVWHRLRESRSGAGVSCAPVPLGRLCVACCRGQSCWRRVQAEKVVLTMRRHRAAACLQSYRRMFVARRSFLSMKGDWLHLSQRRVCLKSVIGAYERSGDRSPPAQLVCVLALYSVWVDGRRVPCGTDRPPPAAGARSTLRSTDPCHHYRGEDCLQVLVRPKRFFGVPGR